MPVLARVRRPPAPSAAAAGILLAVLPSTAWAQSAADQAAAEALFEQGRDLMTAGRYAVACPKFVESERLDPAPGTLLNLATCYERNGQLASAWATYKDAATAARQADQPERAQMARGKAAEIEPRLPALSIVVPPAADRADLKIRRDGEVVGRPEWGTPIPVDPGTHRIEASAPGFKTWQTAAVLAGPSAKALVEVPALEPAPVAQPPAPTPGAQPAAPVFEEPAPAVPERARGSAQRAVGWVLGGVGLAGAAAGAVFGGIALSDKNAAHCVSTVCMAPGLSSMQSAKHAATASDLAFAAGGALVLAGVVLYATAERRRPVTALAVAPAWLGSSAPGALVRGSW